MTRALAASLLSLCFLASACNKSAEPDDVAVDRTGGRSGSGSGAGGIKSDPPASTGGSSGSGGVTGSGGQTTTGSGGQTTTGSGGASASGGSSGGGTSDASADAPATSTGGSTGTTDTAAPASDATSPSAGDAGAFGGDILPGRPYIHLCKKEWSQAQCCEFLCSCLNANCMNSPMDKPRIPMCMSMCMKLTDFRARCQVFHCFESQSPTATKDHDSHCGHASGRVGGGSCTAIMQ
jgi:hypothetical protein